MDDPFLGVLIGTMEEPAGSSNAMRAGQMTLAWWDEHGTGPSRTELFSVMGREGKSMMFLGIESEVARLRHESARAAPSPS